MSGEVVANNDALSATPELINTDPYGAGWIARIRPSNAAEIAKLLDAAAYDQVVAAEAH